MTDGLSMVAEVFGQLTAVQVFALGAETPDAIRFDFTSGCLSVTAESDDTISWALGAADPVAGETPEAWQGLLGSGVLWIWTLTNDHGYVDGLQIEFVKDSKFTDIQLMVEGSTFQVYRLERF